METMKIAVASSDGVNVDQHFGQAKQFLIYKATPTAFKLLDELVVDPYSPGDKDHSFDRDRFTKVTEKLTDCRKIFVTKIGKAPAAELVKMGIELVIYQGPISDISL